MVEVLAGNFGEVVGVIYRVAFEYGANRCHSVSRFDNNSSIHNCIVLVHKKIYVVSPVEKSEHMAEFINSSEETYIMEDFSFPLLRAIRQKIFLLFFSDILVCFVESLLSIYCPMRILCIAISGPVSRINSPLCLRIGLSEFPKGRFVIQ